MLEFFGVTRKQKKSLETVSTKPSTPKQQIQSQPT